MDYYFGANNRYIVTPFSNSGKHRIDFLTLDSVGRPESIVELFAAGDFNKDLCKDVPDFPHYSRCLRVTHSETGQIHLFNHHAADIFALFNGYMHERPWQVYDIAFLRCLEEDNFGWIFGTEGQLFIRHLDNIKNKAEIDNDMSEGTQPDSVLINIEKDGYKSVN